MKKRTEVRRWLLAVAVLIALGVTILPSRARGDDAVHIRQLEARLATLQAAVERQAGHIEELNEQIEAKDAEIRVLREQLTVVEASSAAAEASQDEVASGEVAAADVDPDEIPDEIIYRDRVRTESWFNRMYEDYADDISEVNGQFLWIAGDVRDDSHVKPQPPEQLGRWRRCCRRVAAVIDESNVILALFSAYDAAVWFHVEGIDTTDMVNDQAVETEQGLIYVGIYNWDGRRIQSYVPYVPLTRRQFAEALAQGVVLVDYTRERNRRTGETRIDEREIP